MRPGLTFVMNVNSLVQFEHHPLLLLPEVLQDGDQAGLLLPGHADPTLLHPLKVVHLEVWHQTQRDRIRSHPRQPLFSNEHHP